MFSARAGSALDCSQTGTRSCTACIPSANGGCYTSGSLVAGPTHSAQATVVLNESYGIYPKSSTNPGPNAGAEFPAPADASAGLTVDRIFTE